MLGGGCPRRRPAGGGGTRCTTYRCPALVAHVAALAVFLGDGRGPHGAPSPLHAGRVEHARVLRPVHEVGRRKRIRKHLLVAGYPRVGVRLVGRIHEADGGREALINSLMLAKNGRFRVGVPAGQYGVAGRFGRLVFPWFSCLIPCGPWCSLRPARVSRQQLNS